MKNNPAYIELTSQALDVVKSSQALRNEIRALYPGLKYLVVCKANWYLTNPASRAIIARHANKVAPGANIEPMDMVRETAAFHQAVDEFYSSTY